jgi:hypothetical protein
MQGNLEREIRACQLELVDRLKLRKIFIGSSQSGVSPFTIPPYVFKFIDSHIILTDDNFKSVCNEVIGKMRACFSIYAERRWVIMGSVGNLIIEFAVRDIISKTIKTVSPEKKKNICSVLKYAFFLDICLVQVNQYGKIIYTVMDKRDEFDGDSIVNNTRNFVKFEWLFDDEMDIINVNDEFKVLFSLLFLTPQNCDYEKFITLIDKMPEQLKSFLSEISTNADEYDFETNGVLKYLVFNLICICLNYVFFSVISPQLQTMDNDGSQSKNTPLKTFSDLCMCAVYLWIIGRTPTGTVKMRNLESYLSLLLERMRVPFP